MKTSFRGAGRRLVATGAAAALSVAGLSVGIAAPAHAAATVSGNTIDAAGNYVDGFVSVYRVFDEDGDGTVEPDEGEYLDDASVVTLGRTSGGYTENQSDFIIDNALTLADVDNPTLSSATVSITGTPQLPGTKVTTCDMNTATCTLAT